MDSKFDKTTLQGLYDNRNWGEAIKYLQSFPAKNATAQIRVNKRIDQLKILQAKDKSWFDKTDQDTQQAYMLHNALQNNGALPRDRDLKWTDASGKEHIEHQRNKFGTEYIDAINSLVSKDNKKINKIAIEISNDDYLKSMGELLGVDDFNNNNLGIGLVHTSDGKKRLEVSLNNNNLYKVVNAANKVTSNGSTGEIIDRIGQNIISFGIGGASVGAFFEGVGAIPGALIGASAGLIKGVGEEIYNSVNVDTNVQIKGIDSDNNIIDKSDFNYNDLKKAIGVINTAEELYNNSYKGIKEQSEQSVTTDIEVTQFYGLGHAEAYKAMQENKLSSTEYDKVTERWKEAYKSLLNTGGIVDKEVYAWKYGAEGDKPKTGQNLTRINNEDLPNLQGEIMLAMKEDRLDMNLATMGGELGTLITISPKHNNEKWSKKKGEEQTKIFVKGLYEESAEKMIERSTKTQAAKLAYDMKKDNYELTLDSGRTVGYESGYGAYTAYIDPKDSKVKRQLLSDEQFAGYLNEHFIIKDVANNAIANMNSNGNIVQIGTNGKKQEMSIDEYCKLMSISATNELIDNGTIDELDLYTYQGDIFRKMKKLIEQYITIYNRN